MYLAFAEILAKRVQTRYPGITVDVLATEGTVENLAGLRSGDVDMGLALADVAERIEPPIPRLPRHRRWRGCTRTICR